MHLEWDLNEKETKAMNELCIGKELTPQQIMRQSLSLLQAIHLGLYKVVQDRDNPFYKDLSMVRELTGQDELPAHFSFQGRLVCTTEDGGKAAIGELEEIKKGEEITPVTDSDTLFVRIQSWDEKCKHPDMETIQNKKVKVTVEVIPE